MRILVDGMPRSVGGIGSLIMNIAEVAKNRNDDVRFDFIISDHSAYIPILEEKGYSYYVVPRISERKKYKECITEIFQNQKYDYLWFNNTSKVNLMLPEIAKKVGKTKIMTHSHGVDFEEKGIKRIVFKILDSLHEKRMYSLIDVPLACSEEAADVYYKHDKKLREKTKVIRNGVFTSKYEFSALNRKKIREELGLKDNEILLGAVGRLTKVKNYSFLIDLMKELPDSYKLIIIGEGEDHEALQKQIENLGLPESCFLLGKKSNVNEYLSAMDYFLMPSLNEGMPFSIVEAQTNGLRCVVSDTLSKEVAITDLVSFASLDDSHAWIDCLMSDGKDINRSSYTERIKAAGYSIEDSYDILIDSLR